ncbi:MAG: aldo/keto reductase [Cyanobacteria bacterium J06623_4]
MVHTQTDRTQLAQKTFAIGGDLTVNRLGYGAMRLTGQPSNFGPYADWEGGKALLRRAIEIGVNFIDTAEAYGPGDNENIIADALYPYSEDLVIATKGGIYKPAPGNIQADASPENLRRGVEGSLRRLKRDRIDLYQLHRPDPKVPFAESVQTLATLQREGKIRHIGLSNVTLAQLKEAQSIVAIASVQNRFNQADQAQSELVDYTTEQEIAFIPYGPLGAHPLKQGAALPAQTALSWLLRRSPNIVVIPGTTSITHLEENVATWNSITTAIK